MENDGQLDYLLDLGIIKQNHEKQTVETKVDKVSFVPPDKLSDKDLKDLSDCGDFIILVSKENETYKIESSGEKDTCLLNYKEIKTKCPNLPIKLFNITHLSLKKLASHSVKDFLMRNFPEDYQII